MKDSNWGVMDEATRERLLADLRGENIFRFSFESVSEHIESLPGSPKVFLFDSLGTLHIVVHRQHAHRFKMRKGWWHRHRPAGVMLKVHCTSHANLRKLVREQYQVSYEATVMIDFKMDWKKFKTLKELQ